MSLILLSFSVFLSFLPSLKGQIPEPPSSNGTTWCGPFADTSIPCPPENKPVCAPYPRYCISNPCPQVMEFYNGCVACQDPTVTGYTEGRCVYTCETAEMDKSATVVCAIYQEGCQDDSCRREFQNSFTACQDPAVISFTIEYCPIGNSTGVGENSETGPIGIESLTTLSEPVIAVEEGGVIPSEEQEAPALGYVDCPIIYVTETVACTDQYEPVCAYHHDCTGDVCGVTVGNSCQACSEFGYDYYYDGACEMGETDIAVSQIENALFADEGLTTEQ